jgi:cbb3-type cytochrome oxidase subunit 3
MSDQAVHPAAEVNPGLTQLQRVTNTFTAPSKTFEDIKRGNRSWWLPYLIMILVGYIFFAAVTSKIGWNQVAQNVIHLDPKAEERMSQAPPAQRDMTMKITQYATEGISGATPIVLLIFAAVIGLVLWGTINFAFAGKAKFQSVFAVLMYAWLPGILKSLLGTIVIFAGMAPESFNIKNFAPTNLGAFLNPQETNAGLYSLASAIDFTTIWMLVLASIGVAIVAGVKRSSGYIAVFGWWAILVLVGAGWAAVMG